MSEENEYALIPPYLLDADGAQPEGAQNQRT